MDDCIKACDYTFTFHYVSIKTLYSEDCSLYNSHLHSTMYLLKPDTSAETLDYKEFTFHYVSIKTILVCCLIIGIFIFTFHYVSIKTLAFCFLLQLFHQFTFHYVSIKTTHSS